MNSANPGNLENESSNQLIVEQKSEMNSGTMVEPDLRNDRTHNSDHSHEDHDLHDRHIDHKHNNEFWSSSSYPRIVQAA